MFNPEPEESKKISECRFARFTLSQVRQSGYRYYYVIAFVCIKENGDRGYYGMLGFSNRDDLCEEQIERILAQAHQQIDDFDSLKDTLVIAAITQIDLDK